ncbi:hypothetical protein TWF192_008059 [Orbilia oligospora]|uniref:Secreted protein n=1 Tax=Orbilia oligospora TaxID=2813651 RepID=A0A6G1MKA2_ORBOL|nr:hypothetical protein TWF191_004303 [Orbilia oligospora]KAF3261593.1 hypothetical protein TWF192_008059 [Orbilia oligospora]
MQYSTFIQPVLFVLCMVSCPTWASAIPATNEVSNGIASIGNTANDGFLPYLIEEPHIGEQSSLGSTPSTSGSSLVKRHFMAPACRKAPNGYGHKNVVLEHGVPALNVDGNKNLVVPPKFNCGIAWCRNYKTHKTAIIVCAKPGFKIKRARVAGAAAKLANSCSYDKWKVNGILKDTTGYDIRVSGAGCN